MKYFFILFSVLFALAFQTNAQDKIYLNLTDNSQNEIALTTLSKISFSNGLVKFKTSDGVSNQYNISTVSKLSFVKQDNTGTIDNTENGEVSLYPNPSSDIVFIKNLNSGANFSIYNLSGSMVMTGITDSNQSIDISGLSKGIYLIKTTVKTLKFTKL